MAENVAYGFVGLNNMFDERVSDTNVPIVTRAVNESVDEHNRIAREIMSEISAPTTAYTERFWQRDRGTLQPVDEWGNPVPRQPSGYYDVSYPIKGGATAWGDNRVSRALMTVREANRITLEMLGDDSDWVRRHALAALLTNVSYGYPDTEHGRLTVQPLASGDSVTYTKWANNPATDTHYFAQTGSIGVSDTLFGDTYEDLVEHPVNRNGTVVAYIPTGNVSDVEAMTNFREVLDGDVLPSDDSARLTGSLPGGLGMGQEVLGKIERVWCVRMSLLPDDYILFVVRNTGAPILKMREYPAPQLQGLFREDESGDGRDLHKFFRYAGFGVHNRVGAAVYQVSGNDTTYDIPAGFDATNLV